MLGSVKAFYVLSFLCGAAVMLEDAPASLNLSVYILEHPSRQEAEKNWAAFQADPEWKKVKAESEANGPLVDHIDRYFMDPTSYSALK